MGDGGPYLPISSARGAPAPAASGPPSARPPRGAAASRPSVPPRPQAPPVRAARPRPPRGRRRLGRPRAGRAGGRGARGAAPAAPGAAPGPPRRRDPRRGRCSPSSAGCARLPRPKAAGAPGRSAAAAGTRGRGRPGSTRRRGGPASRAGAAARQAARAWRPRVRAECLRPPARPRAHGARGPSRPGRAEGVHWAPPAAPPAVTRRHPLHRAERPWAAPRPPGSPRRPGRPPRSASYWAAEGSPATRGAPEVVSTATPAHWRVGELFHALPSTPARSRAARALSHAGGRGGAERGGAIPGRPARGCGCRTASWAARAASPGPGTPRPRAEHRAEEQESCGTEPRRGAGRLRSERRCGWRRRLAESDMWVDLDQAKGPVPNAQTHTWSRHSGCSGGRPSRAPCVSSQAPGKLQGRVSNPLHRPQDAR